MKRELVFEKFEQKRLNEEAFNIERIYFNKTSKKTNPRQEHPFKYFKGKSQILLLAPHSVRYQYKKKIKRSDEFTGSIAVLLQELLDCHSLVVTKLYGGDPERDSKCIFKEEVRKIVQQSNIKRALVILGADRNKEHAAEVTTDVAFEKEQWINNISKEISQVGNVKVSRQKETKENLCSFLSQQCGVTSAQIKINRIYRVPHQSGSAYNQMMASLYSALLER